MTVGWAKTLHCAFDLLVLDGEDLRRRPIEERKRRLAALMRGAPSSIVLNQHFDGDGAIIYKHACALGCEGIVSKRLGSPCRSGRCAHWVKPRRQSRANQKKIGGEGAGATRSVNWRGRALNEEGLPAQEAHSQPARRSLSVADCHETSAYGVTHDVAVGAARIAVEWSASEAPQTVTLSASVALLIAQSLLCGVRASCPWIVLMRPSATTCSRIGSGAALLGECERGGSKCDSDCEAQSFHSDHFVFSKQTDEATTPDAGMGFRADGRRSATNLMQSLQCVRGFLILGKTRGLPCAAQAG
jgi:hypothetical protein